MVADQKMAALLAKRAALDARISRLKQRGSAAERKTRNHALLLLGAALEKQMKKAPADSQVVRQIIMQNLSQRDQESVMSYLFTGAPASPQVSAEQ